MYKYYIKLYELSYLICHIRSFLVLRGSRALWAPFYKLENIFKYFLVRLSLSNGGSILFFDPDHIFTYTYVLTTYMIC